MDARAIASQGQVTTIRLWTLTNRVRNVMTTARRPVAVATAAALTLALGSAATATQVAGGGQREPPMRTAAPADTCSGGSPAGAVVVALQRTGDSAPARWWGMTNIFFGGEPRGIRDSVRLGEGWSEIEFADVVQGPGLVTVYATRFKAGRNRDMHYVVDTDGDLDFAEEQPLTFRHWQGLAVADVNIAVRSESGTHSSLPYQVLRSDAEGYVYARISEYRAGHVRLCGHDFAVKLRSRSRNHPFLGLGIGTVFLIDLDGDGTIADEPTVTLQGRRSAAEEVASGSPFMLAGRPYELAELDSMGSRLVLRPSTAQAAAAVGFAAPDFTARTLSGAEYRLASDRGTVVLVEFWSVDCYYSERARFALNNLAARVRGRPFKWLAFARENDSGAVRRHLADHPVSATVALHDSTAWDLYNPAVATPLFFVIDQAGTVRLRAVGASAVEAVEAEVLGLLEPAVQQSARPK